MNELLAVTVLLSMLAGWWQRRKFAGDPSHRWIALVLPVALTVAFWTFLCAIGASPGMCWNEPRILPSFAVKFGYPLYPGRGEGPVLGHIYGPVPALIYYLTTFCADPTSAILLGCVLTVVIFLAPLAIIMAQHRGGVPSLVCVFLFVLFAMQCTEIDSLKYSCFNIHVDTIAIGLGALACAALVSSRPDWQRFLLASLAAALALWSKQLMLALVVALPAIVWLFEGRRAAFAFLRIHIPVLMAVSLLFMLLFGPWKNMYFNLVTIPSGHPVENHFSVLMTYFMDLVKQSFIPFSICALYLATRWAQPERPPLLMFVRSQRWMVFLVVALIMAPCAILGRAKLGGDVNSFSYVTYFLQIAALLCVLDVFSQLPQMELRSRAAIKAMGGIVLTISLLRGILYASYNAEKLMIVWNNPSQAVFEYCENDPGKVYFPWNPVAVLMAEKRLYHFDYGVYDRELAGMPLSQEQFFAHVPENATAVIFENTAPQHNHVQSFYKVLKKTSEPLVEIYDVAPRNPESSTISPR